MERRNLDLRQPSEPASQTRARGRLAITDHVDRVTRTVRPFIDHSGSHRQGAYLDRWRAGARMVASIATAEGAPDEFRPSQRFLSSCGLGGVVGPKLVRLRHYLVIQTESQLASAVHDLLPSDDVDLLLRVGLRHGRPATRCLLEAILPHLVELEYGIAASIGIRVRQAMQDAA